jgi:anti-sigma factor RsiW
MKCDGSHKKMLLAQSGELPRLGRWQLDRHLSACPLCRRYAEEIGWIAQTARRHLIAADPEPETVEAVLRAGRKESSRSFEHRFRPSREPLLHTVRYAILYASLAVLLVTGLVLITRPARRMDVASLPGRERTEQAAGWDDGIDEQIAELGESIATVSTESWGDSISTSTENGDVDSIARELLELEGISI